MPSRDRLRLLFLILLLAMVGIAAWGMTTSDAAQRALPTAMTATPAPKRGILLPDFPPSASQADIGAEVYRLVCQDCHGDRGQGLTAEWRAAWAPADRDCWQSKCHATNHPPEGFILPSYVPPVAGSDVMNKYRTANDLYAYVKARMPWYEPGRLSDEQYWQVTAYLLRVNGFGDVTLTADNAAALQIKPQPAESGAASPTTSGGGLAERWLVGASLGLIVATGLIGGLFFWRKQTRGQVR